MSNSNQPAIPCNEYDMKAGHWEGRYEIQKQFLGLTQRELFAAMAMQGMSSIENAPEPDIIAIWCVRMADALIAELEKNTNV